MNIAINIAVLVLFSILSFWRPNAILFMVTAGMAMMVGLAAPDIVSSNSTTTGTDLTLGLMLVAYSLYCIGMSFRMIFYKG